MGGREGTALGLYLELQRQDRFEGCRTSQPCQGCADGIPEASVRYALQQEQPRHQEYHRASCERPLPCSEAKVCSTRPLGVLPPSQWGLTQLRPAGL